MADAFVVGSEQGQQIISDARRESLAARRISNEELAEQNRAAIDERQQRDRELDAVIDRRHKAAMAEDLEMQNRLRKDQVTHFIEAESSWTKFEQAEKAIDWSNPDAPRQYEMISASYLPGILKDERVTKKWDAYDKAIKDSMRFTATKTTEAATAAAMSAAARIAPDLLLDPPKKPDGSFDATTFATKLREREDELAKQAERLRAIGPSRAATRTGSRRLVLSDTDKQLLAGETRMLEEVRKRLLEMDDNAKTGRAKNPDRYLRLQNEERRIQRRIEEIRRRATPYSGEDDEVPQRGGLTDTRSELEGEPGRAQGEGAPENDPVNLFR